MLKTEDAPNDMEEKDHTNDKPAWVGEDGNLQTSILRDEWGSMDVEFRDYYRQTKIRGPDLDPFLDSFWHAAKSNGIQFMINFIDENEVAIKLEEE